MDGEVVNIIEKSDPERVVLRPVHKRSVPKDGTSRLRSLQCFAKVDELVRAGVFARTIAEYIQDDAREYLDVSFEAVTRSVRRYREQLENAGVRAAKEVVENDDEADPLFELHEMRRNYKQLKGRIDMEVETEKQLNKLFSTTHKEYGEARALLTQILEDKRKLGIIGKDMDHRQRQAIVDRMAGRLDYASAVGNPESRQKVLSIVEMLIGDSQLLDSVANDKRMSVVPDVPSGPMPIKVKRARHHKGRKKKVRADS